MKTIGLIGGLSWESTAIYYRLLNEAVRRRLGGLHSARLLLWSFDFAEIEALQAEGDWAGAAAQMAEAARRLARGGADCLVICSNTMHRMAAEVEAAGDLPLIHIADATAAAIKRQRQPPAPAARHALYHGAALLQGAPQRAPRHRGHGARRGRPRDGPPHHL